MKWVAFPSVMFAILLVLGACADTSGMSDDERYEYCVDNGGSFTNGDDYGEYSCKMPAPEGGTENE